MPIATRLTNTGTLLVNGIFDENTSITPATFRTSSTTVYAGTLDEFTGAPVVNTNLMVWVDAAQTASYSGSGATWTDLSGNGKNYTLTNSPTFSSLTGGGVITFAGASSQYATTATTLFNSTTTNTYSINIWVYPTGAGQIVSVDGQSTPNTAYHYTAIEITAAGLIYFGQWIGSGLSTIATSAQSLNAWYNLVITYNGTTATAYINGTSVGSSAIAWSAPGANTFFALMSQDATNMSGTTAYASGSIGAFSVYNRVLTAAEVAQNYNALRSRYAKTAITATQMPVVQRQQNSGTLLVNSGGFDEFTGAPVVDSTLTMWIDFGQTASYSGTGTAVNDLSPTKTANVTLTGSPTFNSTDGGGSEAFNGTSQYGTGTGTPLGLSAYTKSFWFKLNSYSSNNTVSSAAGGHFSYFGGGNRLQNGHSWWTNFGSFTSVTTFNLNTWYHACVTFNTATGMALYVNGVLDSTYVSTSGPNATNTPVTGTGQCDIANYGGGNNLAGSIGAFMVYNRALTADEITTNFNALRGRYGV